MKTLLTFVLSLFLCQQLAFGEEAKVGSKLHVCTVANIPYKPVVRLLKSCREHHVAIDVLGLLQPQRGLGDRLLFVQDYIKNMSDEDVVVYVASDDALIMANQEEILNAFYEAGVPLVISVDGVSYIGYVGALKSMFKEMSPIHPDTTKKEVLIDHYFEHPTRCGLDYQCKLFMPLTGVAKNELEVDKQNRRIFFNETRSKPCVIQGNGSGRPLYQEIYEEFYKK